MAFKHYVFYATDGHVKLPAEKDKEKDLYIYGFVGGLYREDNGVVDPTLNWRNPDNWRILQGLKGNATLPSPIIWGQVGDRIYITLVNLGPRQNSSWNSQTMHIHGSGGISQVSGIPQISLALPTWDSMTSAPPTLTYYFLPENPGTFIYHGHVNTPQFIQMGLYGAVVIYPSYGSLYQAGITRERKSGEWFYQGIRQRQIPQNATNRNFAYNNIHTYFDKEYTLLLSEVDSRWHEAVFYRDSWSIADYKPDFYLINGRSYPHTLHPHPQTPNDAESLPTYESSVSLVPNERCLLRVANIGFHSVPWHLEGWDFAIIGKDGRPSPFLKLCSELQFMGWDNYALGNLDLVERAVTVTVNCGESMDLLFTAKQKHPTYQDYLTQGQDGFASFLSQANEVLKMPEEVSSEQDSTDLDPPLDLSDSGQLYPMHNNEYLKLANAGKYLGGQFTIVQLRN